MFKTIIIRKNSESSLISAKLMRESRGDKTERARNCVRAKVPCASARNGNDKGFQYLQVLGSAVVRRPSLARRLHLSSLCRVAFFASCTPRKILNETAL